MLRYAIVAFWANSATGYAQQCLCLILAYRAAVLVIDAQLHGMCSHQY